MEDKKIKKAKSKEAKMRILTKILAAIMAFFMIFAAVSTVIFYLIEK